MGFFATLCLLVTSFLHCRFLFFQEVDLSLCLRPRGRDGGLAMATGVEFEGFFYGILATSLKRAAKCMYVHRDSIYVRGIMCMCVLPAPILVTHLETYHLQPPRPD